MYLLRVTPRSRRGHRSGVVPHVAISEAICESNISTHYILAQIASSFGDSKMHPKVHDLAWMAVYSERTSYMEGKSAFVTTPFPFSDYHITSHERRSYLYQHRPPGPKSCVSRIEKAAYIAP